MDDYQEDFHELRLALFQEFNAKGKQTVEFEIPFGLDWKLQGTSNQENYLRAYILGPGEPPLEITYDTRPPEKYFPFLSVALRNAAIFSRTRKALLQHRKG